jgi:hypothetical protein
LLTPCVESLELSPLGELVMFIWMSAPLILKK